MSTSCKASRAASLGAGDITPVGCFLRRTHLDELPQLLTAVRGEMSLVGPRPERLEFVPEPEKLIPHRRDRRKVRPGVTGLAEIQLPADLASVRRNLVCDLHYVRHRNPWLDLRILAATALEVFGVPFDLLRRALLIPGPEAVARALGALHGSGAGARPLRLRRTRAPLGLRAATAG
jgi:lipopolysaccharide/colanic/teichoic acid biosynthesis glycosyltransferase